MKQYQIQFSEESESDMMDIYIYIAYKLKKIATAVKYFNGILDTIDNLSYYGGSLPVCQMPQLRKKYGSKVRTITYKKMTVVFNVVGNVILVRRIMASSMIQ